MGLVQLGKLNYMELLFLRYQKPLYNYFLKCTYDREESQDLTQNTFMRVMKYRQTYRTDLGFRNWLFRIARNLVMDHFRGNKARHDSYDTTEHEIEDKGQAESELRHENENRLYEAMDQLPHDKRELLVMSKLQGMKYEDIAAIRDTSEGAIKVQVHRAVALLRKIYFDDIGR